MTDTEKHARFGAEECPRKLERSRVLTMKYGKHQMVMIRKRMQVESWIEEQINKLFNGSEDHEVFIDLDTLLDMPSVTDKRKFVFGQLQHGFCPASTDKITMFLDELMERVQGL